MIEKYYLGEKNVPIKEQKDFMTMLFDKQDILYGSNADANAARTTSLINSFTSYGALVKDSPTVDDIRRELQEKRPIISFHYGKDLKNKDIPFLAAGSYFHVIVVTGYDDESREFIVNENGDRAKGKGYRYGYDLFMKSLHDFDYSTGKTDGPARVVFTYPKTDKTVIFD
jgi:hypothetical protein